jgi:hypothetical protein
LPANRELVAVAEPAHATVTAPSTNGHGGAAPLALDAFGESPLDTPADAVDLTGVASPVDGHTTPLASAAASDATAAEPAAAEPAVAVAMVTGVPAGPVVDSPTPSSNPRRPSRLVIALSGVLALAVALGAWQGFVASGRGHTLTRTRATLQSTQRDLSDARKTIAADGGKIDQLQSDEQNLSASLADLQSKLDKQTTQLTGAQNSVKVLRTCLQGIAQLGRDQEAGNYAAAQAAFPQVASDCRQADAILGF